MASTWTPSPCPPGRPDEPHGALDPDEPLGPADQADPWDYDEDDDPWPRDGEGWQFPVMRAPEFPDHGTRGGIDLLGRLFDDELPPPLLGGEDFTGQPFGLPRQTEPRPHLQPQTPQPPQPPAPPSAPGPPEDHPAAPGRADRIRAGRTASPACSTVAGHRTAR